MECNAWIFCIKCQRVALKNLYTIIHLSNLTLLYIYILVHQYHKT